MTIEKDTNRVREQIMSYRFVYLPIISVGFFSMKCSQILMKDVVVSFEGDSPWLKQNRMTLVLAQ